MADEQSIQHLLARISAIEAVAAKVSALEARVDVMDDDIPEPQKRTVSDGLSGPTARWSGRVRELYGPEMQIVDVSDPAEFKGTHICYNSGFSASNDPDIYVVKTIIYGRWAWCDVPDQGYPSAPWIIWHVADEILDGNGESYSPKRYRLNDKTTGDITAPIVCGDDGGHVYVNDHNHDDVNRGMRILPNGTNHQVLTIIDGVAKFDYIRAI